MQSRTHVLRNVRQDASSDDALDDLWSSLQTRRLIIFFGAGVSREFPSLAPIARPSGPLPGLIDLLREVVLEKLPPALRDSAAALLPELGLEQLLESVAGVVGDDAMDFLSVLELPESRPNYRHLAMARLAQAGCLRALVTVNFDTFLERSLEALAVPYFVPEEAADEARAYRQSLNRRGSIALLKLHGTLRNRDSLITTIETVGLGLPRYKVAALRGMLEGSDLFFLGYSDNDVDVFREIEHSDIRGRVFWHFLDPPDLDHPALARISAFLRAHRHWIFSGSLDEVLETLLKRIDPEAPARILEMLGFSSLSDVEEAERLAVEEWSKFVRRRVKEHTDAWLTPEASALIVRRSLGESPDELRVLRRELLEYVEHASMLTPRVEIARCNQVGEELAHRGETTVSIRMRRQLLPKSRQGQNRVGGAAHGGEGSPHPP